MTKRLIKGANIIYLHLYLIIRIIFYSKNVICDNEKKKMFSPKNFKIGYCATMIRGNNDNEKYGIFILILKYIDNKYNIKKLDKKEKSKKKKKEKYCRLMKMKLSKYKIISYKGKKIDIKQKKQNS